MMGIFINHIHFTLADNNAFFVFKIHSHFAFDNQNDFVAVHMLMPLKFTVKFDKPKLEVPSG